MGFPTRLFKACTRLVFRLIADRSPNRRALPERPHVLIPRWDAKLGDAIVSSFFFREVRQLNARVTVLTVEDLALLHTLDFAVDEVLVTGAPPGLHELIRLARKLQSVDVVVHLVGRLQPAEILFLRLLRPSLVFSLDDALRCVNRKLGSTTTGLDMAARYQRVLMELGVDQVDRRYIVTLPHPLPDALSAPQILFNPFASRADKSLSLTRSIATLQAIAEAFPSRRIGILSSPATCTAAQHLATAASRSNVLAIPGLTTPKDVAGYLHLAQVVVSVDTAIVHMAVGLGKGLVAIYPDTGEDNPWLPPASPTTRVVYSRQDRGRLEKTGQKNMNAFSTQELLSVLGSLLATPAAPVQTLALSARLVPGLGVAQGTLRRQLPMISEGFAEVGHCQPGTINLHLETALELTQPDHRTPPLAWTPSGSRTEVFDLLRIELEFDHLPTRIPAWLYVAQGSPHRQTPWIHEVIAPPLDLAGARQCRVHLRADAVSLLPARAHEVSASTCSLSASQ